MRGNTDVTNIRSGTALKAVVLYISDYITKVSLKTHVMFDIIRCVLQDNVEILGSSDSDKEKTRRLMTKVVNSLNVKMELGAPMVAMYLLENPDHYASHRFTPFYWSAFTKEVEKAWSSDVPPDTNVDNMDSEVDEGPNVLLVRNAQGIRGLPITFDYTYRGPALANLCLILTPTTKATRMLAQIQCGESPNPRSKPICMCSFPNIRCLNLMLYDA
jgi:hypothetical protein